MSEKRPRTAQTNVGDDGDEHQYFGLIPHTITRGKKGRGLSLPARWFYVYLKSVTGERGQCTRSTTTIVRESQLGRGTIARAKNELATAGLITLSHDDYHNTDRIRIVNVWPENMQEFTQPGCSPQEQQESETFSSTSTPGCSPQEQCCSPQEPKKRSYKKIFGEEEKKTSLSSFESQKKVVPPSPESLTPLKASRRCPPPFTPSVATYAWAAEKYPAIDVDDALEAMRDYEFPKAHADWDATLRTWIRNDAKWASGRARSMPHNTHGTTRAQLESWAVSSEETTL